MAVLTKLSIEQINRLIEHTKIKFSKVKETKNGITDSTYIGTSTDNKKYVFKIFELSSKEHIKAEISILNALKGLKVLHPISNKIVMFENKPTALFSYIEGDIPTNIDAQQIKEITIFLKKLHSIKGFKPQTRNIYEKSNLLKMIESIDEKERKEFLDRFEVIKNINLENNALIHGDLFPDNAKFIDKKLSGVYDFAQSCYGNAYFDLAVVIISWCFKDNILNMTLFKKVLETYDSNLKIEEITPYVLFASLYYAVQRYVRVNKAKDYKEKLEKFDILKETLDV